MPDISDEPLNTLTSTTAGPQVMPYTISHKLRFPPPCQGQFAAFFGRILAHF